jgi:hypothetical protein
LLSTGLGGRWSIVDNTRSMIMSSVHGGEKKRDVTMLIMTHETSVFLGGLFARICLGREFARFVRSEITRVRVAEPSDARVCGSQPGSQTPRVLGSF